jgi:hypothetical protein
MQSEKRVRGRTSARQYINQELLHTTVKGVAVKKSVPLVARLPFILVMITAIMGVVFNTYVNPDTTSFGHNRRNHS